MITNCTIHNRQNTHQTNFASKRSFSDRLWGGNVVHYDSPRKKSALSEVPVKSLAAMFSIPYIIGVIAFRPGHLESKISPNNDWGPNTRVIAAVGQNNLAYSYNEYSKDASNNSNFTECFSNTLEKKHIKTTEEAADSMIEYGYRLKFPLSLKKIISYPRAYILERLAHHPIKTSAPNLEIFDKTKENKDRFVLLLNDSGNKQFKVYNNNFAQKMQEIYKIDDKNILSVNMSSLDDFKKGIDEISQKINTLQDKSKAELVIIYNGHGQSIAKNPEDKKIEGAMDGTLIGTDIIKESQVKKIFKEKLDGIKKIFILSTCHSGAWITENTHKSARYFA